MHWQRKWPTLYVILVISGSILSDLPGDTASADHPPSAVTGNIETEPIRLEIGRTDGGLPLVAWGERRAFQPHPARNRPLLILMTVPLAEKGGEENARLQEALLLRNRLKQLGNHHTSWVFVLLPAKTTFPPRGPAYQTDGERAAAALWRSLAWLGVDLIVEGLPDRSSRQSAGSLASALEAQPIPGFGRIPVIQIPRSLWKTPPEQWTPEQKRLCSLEQWTSGELKTSEVHQEVIRRLDRTPEQVCRQLLKTYGNRLRTVMYQPALAIMARRHFAVWQGATSTDSHLAELLEPFLKQGVLPEKTNGSIIAGHLVFADWALATGDSRAIQLVRLAADVGFTKEGTPLPAMPDHHEMSDAVFMGCPILTAAARLAGEERYLEQFSRHLSFIQKLDRRTDGLYRNSPLCEAAWGRGNGFPMLGLALAMTDLQAIQEDGQQPASLRDLAGKLLNTTREDFQQHARALLKHQDVTGMWRQVIDEPSAYREMTATCMIGFAMQRGIRKQWLDTNEFQPAVDRAWQAVLPRIGEDGVLLDVCTGTGKQTSSQGYFDRQALFEVDERGGAMTLLFAVERLPETSRSQ